MIRNLSESVIIPIAGAILAFVMTYELIQMVTENAHEEKKKVFICGELAADTALTETFLKMGVDGLSVVPACILPVRKAVRKSRREKK